MTRPDLPPVRWRGARTRRFLIVHGLAHEIGLTALAAVWVALGLALGGASDAGVRTILTLSGATGLLFIGDWLLRARASGSPRAWMRRHWAIPLVAVAGVLPIEPLAQVARFILAFLGLRRILSRLGGVFARFSLLDELISLSLISAAAGGVLIFELEAGTNPRIASVFDGLWWALVTVSTVGYGDIAPVTPEGRLVASVLITIGVALFATAVALVGRHLGEDRADAGLRTRLARIAELERLHAAGELETAAFSRRVRELSNAGDGD